MTLDRDLEPRSRRQVERLLKLHDHHRGLVPDQMAAVRVPCRMLVVIEEMSHRPHWHFSRRGAVALIRLLGIGGRPRSHLLRCGVVGRGIHELYVIPVLCVGFLHLHPQPADRPGAIATGAVHEEIAVSERLELQARRSGQVGLPLEEVFVVAMADHEDGAVAPLRRVREQIFATHLLHRDGLPHRKFRRRVRDPGLHLGLPPGPHPANLLLGGRDLCPHRGEILQLLGRIDVGAGLVGVVQEGEQSEILVVREWVELVRVALGALRREAEHRLAHAVDPVEHLGHPEFLGDDRPLFVEHAVAEEAGRHDLVLRGVWQQIAGDLLDHELVERQIAIEGGDHPVAPGPHVAGQILLIAV